MINRIFLSANELIFSKYIHKYRIALNKVGYKVSTKYNMNANNRHHSQFYKHNKNKNKNRNGKDDNNCNKKLHKEYLNTNKVSNRNNNNNINSNKNVNKNNYHVDFSNVITTDTQNILETSLRGTPIKKM